jgi:rod shape determining protein RodA
MTHYRSLRDFDWPLILISLALCGLGVLQIFSATHDSPTWHDSWWKQIIWIAGGLLLMWLVTLVDYHNLMAQTTLLYILSIAGLAATFVLGKTVYGARRWIGMGGFHLQVSEFVKLVIVLLVARYLSSRKGDRPLEGRDLLKLGGLVGLPLVLVMAQPDLGTSLTYLPILAIGIFLAGLPWKYVLAFAVLLVVVLPIGWHFLKDYQRDRLVTFIDPMHDPKGRGYQVIQSKIAVGQGGIWGRGVTRGTQTQLRFLPMAPTDFVFSAFSEEHGFIGVVVALGLYFLLLMQVVQNAQTAPDRAGLYICMGVAALLLFHVLVNVGMVVGRMPVTGIPLPLMSAGGSNILSIFLMLGLVNNVRLRRFVN